MSLRCRPSANARWRWVRRLESLAPREPMKTDPTTDRVRLDKWLWCARFYKTRSLAADQIGKGRVLVNGQSAKASKELRPGDLVSLQQADVRRTVLVLGLSEQRGPAPVAQTLYAETEESTALRTEQAAQRRLHVEPAQSIDQGRPTKRNRRDLADWNRWSASVDSD